MRECLAVTIDATLFNKSSRLVLKVAKSNTNQSEITELVSTIKRQLKAQGVAYRAMARSLNVSSGGLKRTFANEIFTLASRAKRDLDWVVKHGAERLLYGSHADTSNDSSGLPPARCDRSVPGKEIASWPRTAGRLWNARQQRSDF